MKEAASTFQALRQIIRFWRALFEQAGTQNVLVGNALSLLAGLSEGLALLFLVPLIQTLDPTAGVAQGATSWLPQLLKSVGINLDLSGVLALFIGLAASRALLSRQSDLYLSSLRFNFSREIQVRLYSAIAHANWAFLRRRRPADLLAALTTETDRLDAAVSYALELPGRAIIIAANIGAAMLIAPTLTLAVLTTGFVLVWMIRSRLIESLRLGEQLSIANQEYHHLVSEFLAGLKITKSYVAEDQYISAFAGAVDELRDNLLSFTKSQSKARFAQELVGACAVAIFLWVSAGMMHMPVAQVLVLALIFYRLLPLVQGLQQAAQHLLHVAPAARTILELCDDCAAARESHHGYLQEKQAFALEREIRFEHVTFRHGENNRLVLNDVSLRLAAGTLAVLTGPSGAGKSTLLDLLAGLLKPVQGKIWIDNCELTAELTRTWRESIAYVLQEPFLFHATIRANLLVANPDASESELHSALTLSEAAPFVAALPQGIDTVVGNRGSRFSGGERQRLALARALLRKPALLILDEPTSSLDDINEEIVLNGIEALRGKLTMILVTHRPERVYRPDQTLRIDNGTLKLINTLKEDLRG